MYLLGFAMGLSELLGYLIIRWAIGFLPRRKSIIGSYIMSILAISCFLFFGFSGESAKAVCDLCWRCSLKGDHQAGS
jgi:hypothetical protein